MTAVEISAGLRSRSLSATEVVESALEASQLAQLSTNCFVCLDEQRARQLAAQVDHVMKIAIPQPLPLAGVPYAYKDMFTRKGKPAGLGVSRSSLRAADDDTPCLDQLDSAGAITLGRLNLDPYGYSATGLNSHHGHVRNPFNPLRIAGGSSSGSAAAVASGAVPIAIGSDTGGSVRIPAALCGVVGFKPTFGRISRRGAISLSQSQDTIGIIARTVQDVALALAVMAGHDPTDPASIDCRPVQPLGQIDINLHNTRIGIDSGYLREKSSPDIVTNIEASWELLETMGAQLVEVDLSPLRDYDRAGSLLTWCEAAAVHGDHFSNAANDYPPAIRSRLHHAFVTSSADHVRAVCAQGASLARFLDTILDECDVLATNTTLDTAPTIAAATEDAAQTTARLLRTTRPFSFLGLPAITVPAGTDADGLPVGLQLAGRPFADQTVLTVAAAFQKCSTSILPPLLPSSKAVNDCLRHHPESNPRRNRRARACRKRCGPSSRQRHHRLSSIGGERPPHEAR
ncbi:amidase [Mycobacterium montefiorense]|uniref:amidase n=1 Tax=Mycobacterium montefiorense TaxID=154654 RepID=UPI00222E9B52|nr:amidase [Mycobacterium montefiorense]